MESINYSFCLEVEDIVGTIHSEGGGSYLDNAASWYFLFGRNFRSASQIHRNEEEFCHHIHIKLERGSFSTSYALLATSGGETEDVQ